MVSAIENK